MPSKTKLFLHMGPGFHSLIEESIFGNEMPTMEFWNQPKVTSFLRLVKSAEDVFLGLRQEKIDLYAHSFGAQLALKLVQRFPDKIGKIVLLNSSIDPFNCFLNIGLRLKIIGEHEAKKLKSSSPLTKMETIFKIAGVPDFSSAYWFSKEKQSEMEAAFFTKVPPIDLKVFSAVVKDFLQKQNLLGKNLGITWNGPVQIIYSESDFLLNYSEDIAPWAQIFPNAIFRPVQGVGHYAHLESDSVAKMFFY